MKKEIRICDNCYNSVNDNYCYDKGWIMFESVGKYFRIIHKNNEDKTQGRQFEDECLDFCCIDCLEEYFELMVKKH